MPWLKEWLALGRGTVVVSVKAEPDTDVKIIALVKGGERYIWLYTEENRIDVIRQFGRFASDPSLSFDWNDAGMLAQKVKKCDKCDT